MYTQMINEESRQQGEELARLNDKLRKEQHHIEEQRDFIQRILDANQEGMLLCDYMGRILYANPRMTQYFPDIAFVGLTMEEVWYHRASSQGSKTGVITPSDHVYTRRKNSIATTFYVSE